MLAPAELLAILPAPSPPPPSPGGARLRDPAADARRDRQLTRAAFLAALPAPLRAVDAAAFALRPFARNVVPRWFLFEFSADAALYSVFSLNAADLVFGARQINAALAARAVVLFCNIGANVVLQGLSDALAPRPAKRRDSDLDPRSPEAAMLDAHPSAVVVRWELLRRDDLPAGDLDAPGPSEGDDPGPWKEPRATHRSRLLAHDPLDRLCPCPLPSCAGTLPAASGREKIAWRVFVSLLIYFGMLPFLLWTPFVHFAPSFWTSPARAPLGALAIIATALYYGVNIVAMTNPAVSQIRLSHRLQHRGMSIALADLMDRFALALSSQPAAAASLAPFPAPHSEIYVAMHAQLVASWAAMQGLTSVAPVGIYFVNEVLAALVHLYAGWCLTAFTPVFLLVLACLVAADLVGLAASNGRIGSIANLYDAAAASAEAMLRRAAAQQDPNAARTRAAAALAEHRRFLASFAAAARRTRASLFGLPLTWGLVNGVAVALLALAGGVWSLLKSLGVRFTYECVCPPR